MSRPDRDGLMVLAILLVVLGVAVGVVVVSGVLVIR